MGTKMSLNSLDGCDSNGMRLFWRHGLSKENDGPEDEQEPAKIGRGGHRAKIVGGTLHTTQPTATDTTLGLLALGFRFHARAARAISGFQAESCLSAEGLSRGR